MILDDPSLYAKLIALNNSEVKPVIWNWKVEIIVNDVSYSVLNVLSIETIRDFVLNTSDQRVINLQLSQSMYYDILIPNKNNIKVKLVKEPNNISGNTSRIGKSYSQTFRGFLTEVHDRNVMSNDTHVENVDANNMGGLIETTIELHEPELFEYRLHEVGGVYKGCTVTQLVKGLMTHPLAVLGGKSAPVDMVEGDNAKEFYQVIIPNGLRLINLPHFVQERFGIYSTGIGHYFYQGRWYIFPLLNYKRFNTTTRTLTILNIPVQEMGATDNSYILDGDSLIVFSTGVSIHQDKSEHILNNAGRGLQYAIASNIIDNTRDIGADEIPAGRNFVALQTESSGNGLNNIRAGKQLLTDNPFKHLSDLSVGLGSTVMLSWDFANAELLYPGMPVKILFKKNRLVSSLMGTLLRVQSNTRADVANPTDTRYITNCTLTIHCERV